MDLSTGGLDPTPPKPGVIGLLVAPHILLFASAVLAFVLARRDRGHSPVGVALAIISGAGLARWVLDPWLLAPGPYVGVTRVVFHLDQALYLASLLALPWVACVTLWDRFRRDSWPLMWIFWWLVSVAMVALGYPTLRGDALRRVYLAAELGALFVCALAIVSWVRRRARLDAERLRVDAALAKGWDDITANTGMENDADRAALPRWYTSGIVLVLVAGDAALLGLGAWRHGLFGAAYTLQQSGLLAMYFVIASVHVMAFVRGRGS